MESTHSIHGLLIQRQHQPMDCAISGLQTNSNSWFSAETLNPRIVSSEQYDMGNPEIAVNRWRLGGMFIRTLCSNLLCVATVWQSLDCRYLNANPEIRRSCQILQREKQWETQSLDATIMSLCIPQLVTTEQIQSPAGQSIDHQIHIWTKFRKKCPTN